VFTPSVCVYAHACKATTTSMKGRAMERVKKTYVLRVGHSRATTVRGSEWLVEGDQLHKYGE